MNTIVEKKAMNEDDTVDIKRTIKDMVNACENLVILELCYHILVKSTESSLQ